MTPPRRLYVTPVWVAVSVVAGVPRPARSDPNRGESRTITRDADRPLAVVAGEADAAAVVTNPANLGYLRAVSGLVDFAMTAKDARRRGSGVGAFLGIPLPFDVASFGIGFQTLFPRQPDPGDVMAPAPGLETADSPYSKLTLALSIPFLRWVPGLSAGFSYSRLFSTRNLYADRVDAVDVGLSWWASRFFALALVGRSLNQPRTGDGITVVRQPLVLDPEAAFRPLGNRALEVAAGLRAYPTSVPGEARFRPGIGRAAVEPRGRIVVRGFGTSFFAEMSAFRFYPAVAAGEPVASRTALAMSFGVMLDLPHFGAGGAFTGSSGGAGVFSADGGMGRLRFSAERWPGVPVRPLTVTRLALAGRSDDRGMWELVRALDGLERGAVVLLDVREVGLAWAQLEEVREAVRRARDRGARVASYVEGAGLKAWVLATATDRIIAHPQDSLAPMGLVARTFHVAGLLRRLGIEAEFLRIAEYKGAPEMWTRETASEPVLAQRRQVQTDVWNHVVRLVARDRGPSPETIREWVDSSPHPPKRARRLGMLDALAFPDELDAELERWLGKSIRIEEPRPRREHATDFGPRPGVAVLLVEGDLVDGPSLQIPLLRRRIAGSETISAELRRLREDTSVRAVVVRCDSPGGSVSAASAIGRELELLRAVKPVVISMGSVCASGGYWIAASARYLYADATTVTGSIGIFYPKLDLSGALARLGVGVEEEWIGAHAAMRSWWKGYSAEEERAAMEDLRASYDEFVARVAAARSLEPADVDARLARGRVFSGVRAAEVGLVDSYGGLREAVLRARIMAGLRGRELDVRLLPEPPGLLQQVRSLFGLKIPSLGREGSGAATDWTRLLPAPLVATLRQLPAPLWLAAEPELLALDPEQLAIE